MKKFGFQQIEGNYAVCKIESAREIPVWAGASSILAVIFDPTEATIVCEAALVPEEIRCERDWIAFRILGAFGFEEFGILASAVGPLSSIGVGVFVVSTFSSDLLFVKSVNLSKARDALVDFGHSFID